MGDGKQRDPLSLLRLSLEAYRMQRAVGSGNIYSRLIRASRGITAGSGPATTELRLLLIDLVETVQKQWSAESGVDVTLYVDDRQDRQGRELQYGILRRSAEARGLSEEVGRYGVLTQPCQVHRHPHYIGQPQAYPHRQAAWHDCQRRGQEVNQSPTCQTADV